MNSFKHGHVDSSVANALGSVATISDVDAATTTPISSPPLTPPTSRASAVAAARLARAEQRAVMRASVQQRDHKKEQA